jgi:hypothetical protein
MLRLVVVLATSVACAHAAPATPPHTIARDLTPAVAGVVAPLSSSSLVLHGNEAPRVADPFDRCPSARCGATGLSTSLSFAPRREAVLDLLQRYVHAMTTRSPEALRGLFDTVVHNANNRLANQGVGWSREQVIAMHARLFESIDSRGFDAQVSRIASYSDCQRQSCRAELTPGDWYVEWLPLTVRVTAGPNAVPVPTMMVLRWRDERPRIGALNQEFLLRNGR